MVDEKRIISLFNKLISYDSESFKEIEISNYLYDKLKELGLEVSYDDAGEKLNDEYHFDFKHSKGNIYGFLKGDKKGSILFSSHLDTVSPGIGKKAIYEGRLITSDGKTVLGADDVAGLTSIIEALTIIKEKNLSHPDIEILFPIAEEPYCQGSRHFDFSKIKSDKAYVLDLDGEVGNCAIAAPSIISFTIEIFGKSAHAGFCPENGINAFTVLGEALSKIKVGRLNSNTTINFGKVSGGVQRNSIPDYVNLIGEIRSLDSNEALSLMDKVKNIFEEEANKINAKIKLTYKEEIKAYKVDENSDVVNRYKNALKDLGYKAPLLITTFGGSDNNNINKYGIQGIVISCGMNDCHTTSEYSNVDDLVKSSEITLKLMTL